MINAVRFRSLYRVRALLLALLLIWTAVPLVQAAGSKEPYPVSPENETFALSDPVPVDPKVKRGVLPNGVTYYVRENEKPADEAVLRLVVFAGSILEDEDQLGIAHFVEHMAFNGTKHFEKNELVDYLESIGMRFGPEINAFTGFDRTVYKLNVPANEPEVMDNAFQVLEDWAHLIRFDHEEIDKERGVIVEEWRLGRGAQARMRQEYFPVLFKGSRYAERLPIGEVEIIKNADYATIKRFYEDWYRPDLMAVIAVGDFNAGAVEKKIKQQFSKLELPVGPRKRNLYPVPDHEETLFSIATDPETTGTVVKVAYKHDSEEVRTSADYRKMMVRSFYNRMVNHRLNELTHSDNPPFLYGVSSYSKPVLTKSMYQLAAMVEEEKVDSGMSALLREAERVKRHGFTTGELERVKKEMRASFENAYKERDTTESTVFADRYTKHYVEGSIIPGIEYEYVLFKQFIDGITVEEVNTITGTFISEVNRVVLVTGPQTEEVTYPTEEELAGLLNSASEMEVEPYTDTTTGKVLLPDKPVSGRVVSEKEYPDLGIYEWTLSNGATVVLKPTDFKKDEVLFSAFSPGGTSLVSDEAYVSARLASSIVDNSGVGSYSLIELEKLLAGKNVRVSPYIGRIGEGFSGKAAPEDLQTLLELVYLYMTEPREDETAYKTYMNRLRGLIKNRESNPEAAFMDALQEAATGGHFRARPITKELLEEADMETAYRVYRERFADGGDFTFFFTGAFSKEMLKPLVTTYLAALPGRGEKERWKDRHIEFPVSTVERNVYKGIEPKSYVGIVFGGEFPWSRDRQYLLDSLNKILDFKLRETVREEAGGTYDVNVRATASKYPDQEYEITIIFGCDPDRAEELTALVFDQIRSLKNSPPEESYITKTKEAQKRSHENALKENRFWLSSLERYYRYGIDFEKIVHYEELVERLQGEEIQETAREVFSQDRYVEVVLYPENRTE